MRYLLALWFAPLVFFWGWYGLSAHDLNFGTVFLSRELHDVVFQTYASVLKVDAAALPGMFAIASLADSALVLAIVSLRWRREWWLALWRAARPLFRMEPAPAAPLGSAAGEPSPQPTAVAYGPAHPAE